MKELLKYSKELKEFRRSGGLPQGDVKEALAVIYEENFKDKWGVRKIKRGCPSCIRDMMKCLAPEFEAMQVEYKFTVNEPTIEVYSHHDTIAVDSMKWGELRKYATQQGVNTKGKTKKQILEELNG